MQTTRRIAARSVVQAATAGVLTCAAALAGAAPGWAGQGTVQWGDCGPDAPRTVDCAKVAVPLNYGRPRGPQISIGVTRLRAQDRARRVGSLIVNPGGPGGAGSQAVAAEASGAHLWHPMLHRRFDLIGMDPRGIGTSTQVHCDPAAYNQDVSLFPRTAEEFARLESYARAIGESCLRTTGPLLGHVDTLSVVRDMEAVRRALGDGKLNFLGLSYGAEIGTLYAERYPKRIRAMALDGVLDHTVSLRRLFADNARAYEDTFNRFAAWCRRATSCALHGRDVPALFDALVQRADREPLPAPRCATEPCRPTVTGAELRLNSFSPLQTKVAIPAVGLPGWRGYAAALADALGGDASAFASHLATGPTDDPFPSLAVNCVDYAVTVRDFGDFAAFTRLGRELAPHTQGANEAWQGIAGCLRWPVPVVNPPHRLKIAGAPPILLVSASHDPSTPYVGARRVLGQVPRAVLLTREGDGHTSSWLGSRSRTNDAIVKYLLTRRPPPAGTVLRN